MSIGLRENLLDERYDLLTERFLRPLQPAEQAGLAEQERALAGIHATRARRKGECRYCFSDHLRI